MQHNKSKTKSKTRSRKYSAREVEVFKLCSQYESERRKEHEKHQYEEEMRRYERYLQRQARQALPVLNFTPEDLTGILEAARELHAVAA